MFIRGKPSLISSFSAPLRFHGAQVSLPQLCAPPALAISRSPVSAPALPPLFSDQCYLCSSVVSFSPAPLPCPGSQSPVPHTAGPRTASLETAAAILQYAPRKSCNGSGNPTPPGAPPWSRPDHWP